MSLSEDGPPQCCLRATNIRSLVALLQAIKPASPKQVIAWER